jgi:hypothetical protein
VKRHRWFNNFNWEELLSLKTKPPYIPNVKNVGDVSNFEEYPDSNLTVVEIKQSVDPFLCWETM